MSLRACWVFLWAGLVVSVFLVLLGFWGCFLLFFCILLVLLYPFVYFVHAWGAYAFYKTSLILPIKKNFMIIIWAFPGLFLLINNSFQ